MASAGPTRIKFLCFDLTDLNPYTRLFSLAAGTIFFFQMNSFIEEYMFSSLKDFKYALFMTLVELMMFAIIAMGERMVARSATTPATPTAVRSTNTTLLYHIAPLSQHLWVAVWMTFARVLTNVSLEYLSYPTQVIFKSMKLLTVMIGSVVYLRKSYKLVDYVSAVLLVMAAICASFGDKDVDTKTTDTATDEVSGQTIGLVMVTASLVFDSLHSNTQDSLVRQHGASTNEAMLFTNAFAAIATLGLTILTGQLLPAINYCFEQPSIMGMLMMRACVVYAGVLCFLTLVKSSGAVAATAVTTIRKILTIMASFIIFTKPVTMYHGLAIIAFFASVLLSAYDAIYNRPAPTSAPVKPKNASSDAFKDDDDIELARRDKQPLLVNGNGNHSTRY